MPKTKYFIIMLFLLFKISASVLKILTYGLSWRGNRRRLKLTVKDGFSDLSMTLIFYMAVVLFAGIA